MNAFPVVYLDADGIWLLNGDGRATNLAGKVDRGVAHSILTTRSLDGEVPDTAHPPRQPDDWIQRKEWN